MTSSSTKGHDNRTIREREDISVLAKHIVYHCFRNGPIEEIHAGNAIDIPAEASRISDDEMAHIMKTATTKVAQMLEILLSEPTMTKSIAQTMGMKPPSYYEDPDWLAIDAETENKQPKSKGDCDDSAKK